MNRIKLLVSILTCISAISVYPVQKQLTAKQRRLMGMAARVGKDAKKVEEEYKKGTITKEKLIEEKKKLATQLKNIQKEQTPAEAAKLALTIQALESTEYVELEKQFRIILEKAANELPKLYKPALKAIDTFRERVELASAAGGGITQEQAEELYGLIRDLITRITSAVIEQVTKEVDTIAKLARGTTEAFKEGKTQKDKFLTDPEERKDVEDDFNQILAALSSTAKYSNKILQTQKYVDAADEKFKKGLEDSIKTLWLEITSMETQFSSYISEVFIKNPAKKGASDYNEERMSVLLAITKMMPTVGKIGITFIKIFNETTISWIKDTKSKTSKLMEELYKAFEKAYPQ